MHRRHALIALLLAVVACTGTADPDASGAELYSQFCARCHGADLGGGVGPALGAGSELADLPDDFVASAISDGRGSMPAFGSTLTDEQVDRVVAFLRGTP